MSTETGPLLAGRYRLTGRLGSGGMARVHLAVDEVLGRQVAVKVLPTNSPEEALARFRREARVGAQLNHPNVVAIWDSEATEDSILIAMEYVEGETLEDRARGGPIPPEEAVPILEQIASALDHLHAAGVVHRDVKPSNVLVRPDGIAKLSDLGIAVSEEVTEITASGSVVGTLRYLSPERIQGEAAEPASDVYALAVTAFEALSGRQPFESTTPPALLNEIEKGDLDLREGLSGTPAAAAVLERGMARDPAERPGSAGALIDQLRTAYGQPEAASPPPPPPTEATAVLSAAPPEPPPIPTARRRSRSRVPAVLALLAALAVGVALAVAALGGDDEPGTVPRGSGNQANAGDGQPAQTQAPAEETTEATDTQEPETPIDTERGIALDSQGKALIDSGQPEAAIPVLEDAVASLEPGTINYGYALFNLANAYRLAGQPEEAIPLLKERLKINDQLDEVRAELALARAEAGGGDETDD